MKLIRNLWNKYEELIKYAIFGGLTTVVSMAAFYASVWTFLDGNNAIELQIANVISWIVGVAFAYYTNRKYVFKSSTSAIFKEMIKFTGARVATLLLDMAIMFFMVTLNSFNYNYAKIISTVLVIVLNYVFSKIFVFSKK